MKISTAAPIGALALLFACASSQQESDAPSSTQPSEPQPDAELVGETDEGTAAAPGSGEGPRHVEVEVASRSGSALVGMAELTEVAEGLKVVVRVDQIEPGLHGVHIHEKADCSAEDASSAGDHFNPEGHDHGLPTVADQRHLGDLGNMGATAPDGKGLLEIVVPGANLKPDDPHSFLNRALVIHADEDTGAQPSGGAGARVGCAEIR